MKYFAITFDDGRIDTYTRAFPIMQRYGLVGTLFVTTGFVDQSWHTETGWHSVEGPMSKEAVATLAQAGWEIAAHGDRHVTDIADTQQAIEKLDAWLGKKECYGFSIPNSDAQRDKLEQLQDACVNKQLLYIRGGRGKGAGGMMGKLLVAMYTLLKSQWAYDRLNQCSLFPANRVNVTDIPSVVVRKDDDPSMLMRFIDRMPDETCVVLMLHSILKKEDRLYGADGWCWDHERFDTLCSFLHGKEQEGSVQVIPLERIVQNAGI